MLFDHFDMIRIIDPTDRVGRRSEGLAWLQQVGLASDPRVEFFDRASVADAGMSGLDRAHWLFRSHLEILEAAAAKGQSVLMLEDDIDFAPGATDFTLPADWQIFYGDHDVGIPVSDRAGDVAGAHFIGFSADIVPQLAVHLRTFLQPGDQPSIGDAYAAFQRAHPEVRTMLADPVLGRRCTTQPENEAGQVEHSDHLASDVGEIELSGVGSRPSGLSFGFPEAIVLAVVGIGSAALFVWSVI